MNEGGVKGGKCREGSIYRQLEHGRKGGGGGGQVFCWEQVMSQAVSGWGGERESRRGRGRKDRHSSFIDTMAETFSNDCWPLLRHFFFPSRMGLRKSWQGVWSASSQCRPCDGKDNGSITADGRSNTLTRHTLENGGLVCFHVKTMELSGLISHQEARFPSSVSPPSHSFVYLG